jgi:hypothetical protein
MTARRRDRAKTAVFPVMAAFVAANHGWSRREPAPI